jgi:hypothetical protein
LANIARELTAKVALYNMLVSLREGAGRSDDGERLSYSRPKLIHKAQVKTKEDEKGRSIASAGRRSKVTYKEGRVYQIKLSWFNKTEHYIRILRVFPQRLGDVSPEEAGKEGFSSVEGFQAKWVEIYGSWNPDEMVTAYEFKLLENEA